MDWRVLRNTNRDTEREHLNKILQEILSTVSSVETQLATVQANQASASSSPAYANFIHFHSMSDITDLPTLASGTYTPVSSGLVNLTSLTLEDWQYLQVGETVTVSGRLVAECAGGGATSFEVTIPVASDFAAQGNCAGVGCVEDSEKEVVQILGSITNNTAVFAWHSSGVHTHTFAFTFTYRVL